MQHKWLTYYNMYISLTSTTRKIKTKPNHNDKDKIGSSSTILMKYLQSHIYILFSIYPKIHRIFKIYFMHFNYNAKNDIVYSTIKLLQNFNLFTHYAFIYILNCFLNMRILVLHWKLNLTSLDITVCSTNLISY